MIRRLFKILAWSAGILALLAGAGLWALDWYLGTADFKHRVENLFYRGTGYVLEIHEDLGVTVYPWLGVEAVGVVLRHENGGEALAAATQVSAAVDVPSLLDHHLDLNTLVFRQLEVNVHFDAAGRTGWEGLLEMAGVSGVGGADGRVSDIRRLRARNFVVRGLQMEDSEFHYADERSGQSLIVSNVDLHTGAFEPGRPLSVDLAGHVDLRHPALGATVRLIGDVQADLAKNSARLDGAVLDLELSGLPGHPDVPLQAAGRLSLDSAAATARLDNLHATWAGLTLAGALEAEDLYGRPQVQGSLALERFAVREAFNGFHKGLIPDADPGIFGPGRLSADVKATLDRVELTNLHAGMDDSQAAGRIAWVPGDKPSVSWDLTLDHIDFDRYYKLFTTPEDFYLADFFPDLPLDAVLSGRLRVGRMTVGGAPVEGADLRLDSGDGVVRLDMPQAKAAGGGVTARLEATVERDGAVYPLALSGQLRFTGADAAGLPFGSGKDWELTGKGDADIGVSLPRTPFAKQRIIDDVLRLASLKAAYRLRPGTLRVAGKDGKKTVVQYKSLALNATIKGAGQG
ncbi:MAG: AsmA family protein, partial [Desulfovibrionaceae bacterium]